MTGPLSTTLVILLLSLVSPCQSRSLSLTSRRRRLSVDRYDRSLTTFSPLGRLPQLEYAWIAAQERAEGLTVGVEWDGVVIVAHVSHEEESTVHRLSSTHLMVTCGLAGDARVLASAVRRLLATWTHEQLGETIHLTELVKEVAGLRHGIGLRTGARVLAVVAMIVGLDHVTSQSGRHLKLYKSLPGGVVDQCRVCCLGGGVDAKGEAARMDATNMLMQLLSDMDAPTHSHGKQDNLQRIIDAVGRLVLKHHPAAEIMEQEGLVGESDAQQQRNRAEIDIWVVRAVPATIPKESPNGVFHATQKIIPLGQAFISEHRRLGTASMDVRFASRVSIHQLSNATQCLLINEV